MSVDFLDLTAQYESMRDEIDGALSRVVASQHFILGPEVEALEAEVADFVGVPYAVGCASGTDALLLVLRLLAMDAPEGAEVVLPSFTFFATAGAAWNAGLRPVFCDVDRETFNITRETVEAALSDRTVAVIPVHLFGQMAPMDALREMAGERDIFLLEDAAQAIGARLRSDHPAARDGWVEAGGAGDAGAFSFFPTKNLGGFGDGGMITTRSPELAERLRKLRVHGGLKMYHHEMVGTNSRLDALQAAVLRAKLPRLPDWVEARRANAELYDELLSDVEGVAVPVTVEGAHHAYNQYTLRAQERDDLRSHLSDRGVGSGVYYPVPLHLQDCFSELGHGPGDLPVSEALSGEVLSLPVYPELGEDRIRVVADAVKAFYA